MINSISTKIKKILTRKNKGQTDLICSLIAITALIAILFLVTSTISRIQQITTVDQIARQAVITLETTGGLTTEQINNIENTLKEKGLSFTGTDGIHVVHLEGGKWTNVPDGYTFKYGEDIGVRIECEIKTLDYDSSKGMFGTITSNGYKKVTRLKTSITKAANK